MSHSHPYHIAHGRLGNISSHHPPHLDFLPESEEYRASTAIDASMQNIESTDTITVSQVEPQEIEPTETSSSLPLSTSLEQSIDSSYPSSVHHHRHPYVPQYMTSLIHEEAQNEAVSGGGFSNPHFQPSNPHLSFGWTEGLISLPENPFYSSASTVGMGANVISHVLAPEGLSHASLPSSQGAPPATMHALSIPTSLPHSFPASSHPLAVMRQSLNNPSASPLNAHPLHENHHVHASVAMSPHPMMLEGSEASNQSESSEQLSSGTSSSSVTTQRVQGTGGRRVEVIGGDKRGSEVVVGVEEWEEANSGADETDSLEIGSSPYHMVTPSPHDPHPHFRQLHRYSVIQIDEGTSLDGLHHDQDNQALQNDITDHSPDENANHHSHLNHLNYQGGEDIQDQEKDQMEEISSIHLPGHHDGNTTCMEVDVVALPSSPSCARLTRTSAIPQDDPYYVSDASARLALRSTPARTPKRKRNIDVGTEEGRTSPTRSLTPKRKRQNRTTTTVTQVSHYPSNVLPNTYQVAQSPQATQGSANVAMSPSSSSSNQAAFSPLSSSSSISSTSSTSPSTTLSSSSSSTLPPPLQSSPSSLSSLLPPMCDIPQHIPSSSHSPPLQTVRMTIFGQEFDISAKQAPAMQKQKRRRRLLNATAPPIATASPTSSRLSAKRTRTANTRTANNKRKENTK